MPQDAAKGSFERWREAQRQLHAVERQIRDLEREHKAGRGPTVPGGLVARRQELRLEVDALFSDAMRELEHQVSVLKAQRPRLGDL